MKLMTSSSLILLLLSGCARDSAEIKPVKPLIDTYCATYVPVYTSKLDTEETKLQVDKNNAVWLVRCEDPKVLPK